MTEHKQPTVAVIGLGAQGLVTVKNLLEQGFHVTGFDQNPYIGGIWKYAAENTGRVSALPTTVINISRERGCFTDYAFKPGTSSFPSSAEVWEYLCEYADHYQLHEHLRLGTAVKKVEYDENGWNLTVGDAEVLRFDKLVMATGPHNTPKQPDLEGDKLFEGSISHSVSFKNPEAYQGKRTLVVGASNTAADTACSLVGIACKVYLSHRHGALVLPRFLKDGTSMDHKMTYRTSKIKDTLESITPRLSQKFMDQIISKVSHEECGEFDPKWNLAPPPSLWHQVPTVSDYLVGHLRSGDIESCTAPLRVLSGTRLELQDGEQVDIDAIVWCTGYALDLSILGHADPTLRPDGTHDNETPQLYQNVLSLKYPHSLAFVGIALNVFGAFLLSDLTTMALAQLWSNKSGSPRLPNQAEMEKWYAEHLKYVADIRSLSPHGKYVKLTVKGQPWFAWATNAAGTNVDQHLSYTSLQAWRFWLTDRKFCSELMDGPFQPALYRVFDSDRRKKWNGARETILRTNEEVRIAAKKRREAAAS